MTSGKSQPAPTSASAKRPAAKPPPPKPDNNGASSKKGQAPPKVPLRQQTQAEAPPSGPKPPPAKSAPTATAPPAKPAAAAAPPASPETAPHEEEVIAQRRGTAFLLFKATPAWAVSMAVHFVLLIVLALWPLAQAVQQSREIVLLSEDAEVEEELAIFEPMEMEVKDLEVQEISTDAIAAGDIGMANLGNPAEFVPTTAKVGIASMDNFGEDIGLLFGQDGKGMADVGAGYGGAEFFGVKAGGRKFVFIVDSSKSMGGGKFEAACYELAQAVRRLNEDQLFYVIFFDWDANRLRLGKWDPRTRAWTPNEEPEDRAVLASEENKAQVEAWMQTVELELKTLVLESFQYAMGMYPDAIYVLTDGRFGDTKKVEKYLAENNYILDELGEKKPKVVIHTVGFYNRDGEPVLQKMAKDFGGTYRFVPDPKEGRKRKKKK